MRQRYVIVVDLDTIEIESMPPIERMQRALDGGFPLARMGTFKVISVERDESLPDTTKQPCAVVNPDAVLRASADRREPDRPRLLRRALLLLSARLRVQGGYMNAAHTHLACWYHGATKTEPLCERSRRKLKLTTDPKLVDCPTCRVELERSHRGTP